MEELRRMREQAGLTQVGLSKASGVDRGTIIKIESGKRSPSIETLEKLARAMGAEVGDFFPKAQAPLPLEDAERAWWRGVKEAKMQLDEAGPFYTEYEALGRVLASGWHDDLRGWEKKIPEGESPRLFDFGALIQWTLEIGTTKHMYEAIPRDSGRPLRKELEDTLRLMEEAYQSALNKVRRVFEPAKTYAEFRRIWNENEMDDILSKAERP